MGWERAGEQLTFPTGFASNGPLPLGGLAEVLHIEFFLCTQHSSLVRRAARLRSVRLLRGVALELAVAHLAHAYIPVNAAPERQLQVAKALDGSAPLRLPHG